jgi:hypothetical protein
MRHTSGISHPLPHVTHGIHYWSRNFRAWWHHHFDRILTDSAHFCPATISRSHVHTTAYRSAYGIACSIEGLGRNTHILHNWAHHVAHGFECSAHIGALAHGSLKSLHTSGQRISEASRVCHSCIHNFWRHWWHWHWEHHISISFLRLKLLYFVKIQLNE